VIRKLALAVAASGLALFLASPSEACDAMKSTQSAAACSGACAGSGGHAAHAAHHGACDEGCPHHEGASTAAAACTQGEADGKAAASCGCPACAAPDPLAAN